MQHVRIRSYTLDNLNLGSVSRSRCCSMKQMNSRVFGIQQDHIHDKRMLANPDHRIQQGGNTNEEKIWKWDYLRDEMDPWLSWPDLQKRQRTCWMRALPWPNTHRRSHLPQAASRSWTCFRWSTHHLPHLRRHRAHSTQKMCSPSSSSTFVGNPSTLTRSHSVGICLEVQSSISHCGYTRRWNFTSRSMNL